MKPQFQHKLATSYMLWFENFLFKKAEAYSVQTGKFFHYVDDRLPAEYEVFGSSYKQMLYDSSLPNVVIPNGLYVDQQFVEFNEQDNINQFLNTENSIKNELVVSTSVINHLIVNENNNLG